MVKYRELNKFQKIVLSLASGFSASKKEMHELQQEFLRLDKNHTGTLTVKELQKITETDEKYKNLEKKDWEHIVQECDLNGDGVIDF